MKILVTGAKGMLGTAFCNNLKTICNKKNTSRPNIQIEEIYEYDIGDEKKLEEYCKKADFIFNFAGANRSQNKDDFINSNVDFIATLLNVLKKYNSKASIMFSSSIQATLIGRYNNDYGRSKKAGEELFFDYAKEFGTKVAVYRFPNIMGHSKPKYNSFVSTLCYCVANDESYVVDNMTNELELLYIDDLIDGMLDLLEGKEHRCNFNGINIVESENGKYCYIPNTYKVKISEIVKLLEQFKAQPATLMMPKMPNESFAKRLYSLYLTYLPVNKFKYEMKMNIDDRGSFTELLRTEECGQVSVNISKPGITKGQHWHNSKWELFVVVQGHGLIQERNINTGEKVEFEVSGDKIEAVHMIPGWTHSIINLSKKEKLVTIMICNEIYNPSKADTFYEKI